MKKLNEINIDNIKNKTKIGNIKNIQKNINILRKVSIAEYTDEKIVIVFYQFSIMIQILF